MKPKIFVASSVEGLNIAYPLQVNLQHEADITVWSQGVFSLSQTSLDSLTNALSASDFGIFVFSPDDETKMRGNIKDTVRDNVLFELGLFIGRLGKCRCFIVMPDNIDIHIPSDLIGVAPAKYSGERDISEIAAALGPACHEIRQSIKKLGRFQIPEQKSKIPANEYDSYDETDKTIILQSWLLGDTSADGEALKYSDLDKELELEPGTSKKFLPDIIRNTPGYTLESSGANIFRFLYGASHSYFP